MNTKRIGDITEAKIIARFLEKNCQVSIPYGDCSKYDIIVEFNNKLNKIQCKTGRIENNCVMFKTYSKTTKKGKNKFIHYTKQNIDYFASYCKENNKFYLVPISDLKRTHITLRLNKPKNSQSKKIVYSKKYEI